MREHDKASDPVGPPFARLPWPSILYLLGSAFYVPLQFYVDHSQGLNRGYRLVAFGALTFVVLALLSLLATYLGAILPTAMQAVASFWLISSVAGRADAGGKVPWMISLLIATCIAVAILYIGQQSWSQSAFAVLALVLIGGPIADLGLSAVNDSTVRDSAIRALSADDRTALLSPVTVRPDVWVLILDGYPSRFALNLYDVSARTLSSEILSPFGFSVSDNALAPYSMTHLSLPAILDARYIAEDGASVGEESYPAIRQILGGDNLLVRGAQALGYDLVTIVENGWHLSACDPKQASCVGPPILDEQLSVVAGMHALGRGAGLNHDDGIASGARAVRASMRDLLPLDQNEQADLIVLHLLSPHPPLIWDADCSAAEPTPSREGLLLGLPQMEDERLKTRRGWYANQVSCVSNLVVDLVQRLTPESVVAIVGDHGPDSLGQLLTPTDAWSREMTMERMLTTAALRLPPHCESTVDTVIDVVPLILECIGGVPSALLQPDLRGMLALHPDTGMTGVSEISPTELSRIVSSFGDAGQ